MNLSETQAATDPPMTMQPPESILSVTPEKDPSARFRGEGTTFRAKIIGVDDVPESRGDKMCQDSILKLKAIVKASGQHKQKIVINISLNGIKIINLLNAQILHEHRVDRISFIARDLTDRRAFGYIFGIAEGKHKFFAIKTAKPAEHVVLALRDLFQVVYDMKKREVEVAKQQETPAEAVYAVPNNIPVQQPAANLVQQQGGNLNALQKELDNIHKMSDMDAFKNPWPENTPTSPDTPGLGNESDMFGMANLSDISSLSSDFSLASASSSAPDSSRALDSKNRLKDGRPAQPECFHRTSSGKSAVSWNGTTQQQRTSGRKKRHGSLTATHMKELSKPVAESASHNEQSDETSPVKRLNESAEESASSQENNNLKTQLNRNDSMKSADSKVIKDHTASTKAPKEINNVNTFFNDVMAATGLTTQVAPVSNPEDNISPVKKVSDTMDSVSRSDSLSSVSSSTSNKASTPHKSMSISNLFFSKSDKNKSSLKRKPKFLSRQSSGSSVVSTTDKAAVNVTNTLGNGKSNSSLEKTASVTSLNSAHSCRKSSSSSVTSGDRTPNTKLTKGFSVASLSSQPDTTKYESPTAHERIRPTAAMARPRPRAALSRKVSNVDSKNPPMFKTKGRLTSDSEDECNSQQKGDFPVSTDCNVEGKSIATSTEEHRTKQPDHSWACFNDDNQKEVQKSNTNEAGTSWEAFSDGGLEHLKESEDSEVCNSFAQNDVSEEPTPVQNVPKPFDTTTHPFSDPTQDPFQQDPFSKVTDDPFQTDPFSADMVSQAAFDNYDPFEEITLDSQQEDPFQNYEAVFNNISLSVDSDKPKAPVPLSDENKSESNSELSDTPTLSKETVCADSESNSLDKLEHSSTCSSASSCLSVSPSPSPYLATAEAPSPSEVQDDFTVSWEQNKPVQNFDLVSSMSCPSPLTTDKSDEEVANIQCVSKPPPIPPRPPVRDTLSNDVSETLPPTMPPPPLPARIDVNISSSKEENFVKSLAELHAMPPNCKPPDLPSEIRNARFDPSSTNSKDTESGSSLSDNEERFAFPPNSDPPALPSCGDTALPTLPFLPPSSEPPKIPARNKSCSGPTIPSTTTATDDLSMSDGDVTDKDQPQPNNEINDYSNDLAALSMNTGEQATDGAAKLTKDQILSGFGQGGMYQQQQANFFPGQQQSPFAQQQQQQPLYSVPQRRAPPTPANPFAGSYGGAPQPQATTGMFPPGPSPVIPARPGAMNPPTTTPAQTGAAQNPFGDAFGGGSSAPDGLLTPANNAQSGLINGSAKEDMKADPFANLVPGMGSTSTNSKDLFKDFQIAKPPQPPPRSNDSVSANFDNYFRTAVGGVPLDESNNEPIGQKTAQNPLAQPKDSTADQFAMFGSNDTEQSFNFGGQQQSSNIQSLFG